MKKVKKAVQQTGIKQVAIGGGVSANSGIRKALKAMGEQYGWETFVPKFDYCTDNAAMVGIVGYYKFLEGQFSAQAVTAQPRLSISKE